jgi:hypothetical protein
MIKQGRTDAGSDTYPFVYMEKDGRDPKGKSGVCESDGDPGEHV